MPTTEADRTETGSGSCPRSTTPSGSWLPLRARAGCSTKACRRAVDATDGVGMNAREPPTRTPGAPLRRGSPRHPLSMYRDRIRSRGSGSEREQDTLLVQDAASVDLGTAPLRGAREALKRARPGLGVLLGDALRLRARDDPGADGPAAVLEAVARGA